MTRHPSEPDPWAEWVAEPDGMLSRHAARVLLIDGSNRVLMMRGSDSDRPERTWWFTLGGGIAEGESAREGAARELWEECGLLLSPQLLDGPVATRTAEFDFEARTVRQHEVFFVARLPEGGEVSLDQRGWTEIERRTVREVRWLSVGELDAMTIEVFPNDLARVLEEVVERMGSSGRWEGVPRVLGR